ncbi:MAG: ATP-binding protein [Melioribacteraceae bacterium]|nr:ATP-binding protein [Melioribacteraceae bacterium]MCF8355346.1 ATP-binding protein [Melioribacteraceae bacterium]MCF8392340.1 ATP-binding protein [Melioribacteraceae bacterium]MCF8417860.1 ATP-binding protein [Melioribacteraceae bacterium]
MQFRRKIQPELEKQITTREVVVITGMRRTGKTTLMRMLFDSIKSVNKVFLDLQNILDQKLFDEIDYNNIFANLKSYGIIPTKKVYLFIDEIQFKPEVTGAVKYLYDHYDVKFFITGSSSFYLKNLFPQSLAGRKVTFELFPLFFEEFLTFNKIPLELSNNFNEKSSSKNFIEYQKLSKYYEEYIRYGGFPQVVLEKDEKQKQLMLRDIFNSYFQLDVITLADFKKIDAFKKLIFILMERVGSKLDISKLSSILGVSRDTVYSYISLLEGTYFIFLINPFTLNRDKEISGTKKVYLCDNGIVNQFSQIAKGSLLENSVFLNLKKYEAVNYYQKRSGAEIDFIVKNNNNLTALEVKTNAVENDLKKLKRLSENLSIDEYYLVSHSFSKISKSLCAYQV